MVGLEFFCALYYYPASVINTHLKLMFIRFNSMDVKCKVQSGWSIYVGEKYGKLELHHLGLFYLSDLGLYSNRPCGPIDVEGFYQVEIEIDAGSLEVEKIGFCLYYSSYLSGEESSFDDYCYSCYLSGEESSFDDYCYDDVILKSRM